MEPIEELIQEPKVTHKPEALRTIEDLSKSHWLMYEELALSRIRSFIVNQKNN